jgi:heme-degrading monooxygenase HmoA
MLYELRRYDVAASKLPALVDRFGSFTVHKWKEYGFRLIGFWTPLVSEKSNQVVYIWGWESYEERTKKNAAWRADPERAKKWAETEKDGPLVNRVYNQLMEPTAYSQLDRGEPYGPDASSRSPYIFELREYQAMPGKITNITDRFGNFTCGAFKKHGFRQVGYWHNRIGGNDHQLIYLLAWESLDERVAKFDTFAKDPERARVFAESEKNGPIVQQVANTILRPTAFSPMK